MAETDTFTDRLDSLLYVENYERKAIFRVHTFVGLACLAAARAGKVSLAIPLPSLHTHFPLFLEKLPAGVRKKAHDVEVYGKLRGASCPAVTFYAAAYAPPGAQVLYPWQYPQTLPFDYLTKVTMRAWYAGILSGPGDPMDDYINLAHETLIEMGIWKKKRKKGA